MTFKVYCFMIILSAVPVEFNSRIVHSNGRELNIIRLLGEGGRETVRGVQFLLAEHSGDHSPAQGWGPK